MTVFAPLSPLLLPLLVFESSASGWFILELGLGCTNQTMGELKELKIYTHSLIL